ncbi:hypothetical protein BX666DRAFT_368142 [Dichotomocladium elegans]|nr:hypothetical protein BX666DRAFT_368142 [Dichotomocladium elegans]
MDMLYQHIDEEHNVLLNVDIPLSNPNSILLVRLLCKRYSVFFILSKLICTMYICYLIPTTSKFFKMLTFCWQKSLTIFENSYVLCFFRYDCSCHYVPG